MRFVRRIANVEGRSNSNVCKRLQGKGRRSELSPWTIFIETRKFERGCEKTRKRNGEHGAAIFLKENGSHVTENDTGQSYFARYGEPSGAL